jgi:hypothetical protein
VRDLSAGEERRRDSQGGHEDGRCQEFVFHRHRAQGSIAGERYAASGCVSIRGATAKRSTEASPDQMRCRRNDGKRIVAGVP